MRLSLVYFLAVVATFVDANNLRRFDDADEGDSEDILPDESAFDGIFILPDGKERRLPVCDEICRARRRLVRCKKKAREERRQGRNAWKDEDDVPDGRRLKLYCEYRYRWQEKKRYCPEYCLEASKKWSGATLEIKDCSRSPLQKFKEVNGILRPAWSNRLCVKSDKLRNCDDKLIGFKGDHFEIKLKRRKNERKELCFSNPHHPKNCEPVRFSECKEARNSHTENWTWD